MNLFILFELSRAKKKIIPHRHSATPINDREERERIEMEIFVDGSKIFALENWKHEVKSTRARGSELSGFYQFFESKQRREIVLITVRRKELIKIFLRSLLLLIIWKLIKVYED